MTKKQIIEGLNNFCNCRVKCSDVHGVGLFAIREIPAETSIFGDPDPKIGSIHFFTHLSLKKLPEEILELLYDYNFINSTGMHLLDYAWNYHHLGSYINHSYEPNVRFDVDHNQYFAMRDIHKDEELLCNLKEDLKDSDYKIKFLDKEV